MRILGIKVKCGKFILISDKVCGDCILKREIEEKEYQPCILDETCKMPERIRNFITRYVSS